MKTPRRKKVSIKDIAREAGVSTASVSFVLNGKQKKYRISDEVAARVREVARELDYKPNGLAKSLREGTSRTIGVIVSDIANPFFAYMVKTIETIAEEYGYMALFASSDEDSEKMDRLANKMLSKEVTGMILVPCEGSEETIKNLLDKKVPLVLLDRNIPEIRTSYVSLNNRKAGYDATMTLINKGLKKIAFVCYGLDIDNMRGRMMGYMDAMKERKLDKEIQIQYIDIKNLEDSCNKAMNSVIRAGCEGIICATNSISIKCLKYIHNYNIRIPEDIVLVGFDGGTEFKFCTVPLIFVYQPLDQIAQKSVEILINQMESNEGITTQIEIDGTISEENRKQLH